MSSSVESDLEDYIWGRTSEQNYLERIVLCDEFTSENILRRVSEIDETLNKQLRKGVEENLSRLLEQTTALEALDATQRNVHSEMNEVHDGCDRFAKLFDSLLSDYRSLTVKLEGLIKEKNLVTDALRCEELMDALEKRNEIVKRSEIISEIKGIVADNADLLSITWLRESLTTRLKAIENEVRRSAADDMRRGLVSLNASLIASATRALDNLGVLHAEQEVQLSSSASEIDAKLLELSSSPDNARLLQQCVNLIHSQLEQCALLGADQQTKFIEKLARIIRARVALDAPYILKFVQQLSRVLNSRPECAGPLLEALKPLKNAILSRSLATLHKIVDEHDFNAAQNSVFADVLISAVEDEEKRLEWDPELKEETRRNIAKCLSMVAKRLESELKLDQENLLFGDRLRSDQLKNYRLLEVADALAAKYPNQAEQLLTFENDTVSLIMSSIKDSIFAIVGAMHRETLGSRDVSPYMQELLDYINHVEFHFSHFPSALRRTDTLPEFADHILKLFILHASLVRPLNSTVRQQLRTDCERLLDTVETKLAPSGQFHDRNLVLNLFSFGESNNETLPDSSLPMWIYVHILISSSPDSLPSPHQSVGWTIGKYVQWCCEHPHPEIISFLSGLMTSYTTSVINRGETQYVPHYPTIMEIIRNATASSVRDSS
ncbi:hypothetical protein Q1695_008980 [Nippostrongylus brasiliensis]|nr:hypothetical protein Q1695_008980 [Nippostrongylus brasiliensis]